MLSIIVPVYRNERNVERLVQELQRIAAQAPVTVEVVFVVDGSPDRSKEMLAALLPQAAFHSRLVSLTRNFGPFNAVRCGLATANGDYIAVLAADLQEPPELVLRFLDVLRRDEADVVFATPSRRDDPWFDQVTSRAFWSVYRKFVLQDLPPGGVHVFGCTRAVRNHLVELREPTFNLIALLFWVGYRRAFLSYERQARRDGRSAWTAARRLRYAVDSIFNFTDVPIRLLLFVGMLGTVSAVVLAIALLTASFTGRITVPGYAPTVLVVTFFGSITSLGLGILGQYVWLILQTTRGRPAYLVEHVDSFSPAGASAPVRERAWR